MPPGGGCAPPCETQSDCPLASYCSDEGLCLVECTNDVDCDLTESCSDNGRCVLGSRPTLSILSPQNGDSVDDGFTLVLEANFRGALLQVELEPAPGAPGTACVPFAYPPALVPGDARQDRTVTVTFDDVPVLADTFSLSVRGFVTAGLTTQQTVELHGIPPAVATGVSWRTPAETTIADPAAQLTLSLAFDVDADISAVWAYVEPSFGPASPRRFLGTGPAVEGWIPLARGPQIVRLELDRGGEREVCGRKFFTEDDGATGVEAALFFNSDVETDLDLWLFSEREGEPPALCSQASVASFCRPVSTSRRAGPSGHDTLSFDAVPGIYGFAVRPGAAAGPVEALLRISHQGNHLGWLGPMTIEPSQGEVWLAGRLYLIEGTVSLEPLDFIRAGLPTEPVSTW